MDENPPQATPAISVWRRRMILALRIFAAYAATISLIVLVALMVEVITGRDFDAGKLVGAIVYAGIGAASWRRANYIAK